MSPIVSGGGAVGAGSPFTLYGDGSDGVVTISADTSLTRDMFYQTLTVNAGKRLDTGQYRVYVRGTLTNRGTISGNGLTATDQNGAAATFAIFDTLAGGNGVALAIGAGSAGGSMANQGFGGAGGAGGAAGAQAGGAGGTSVATAVDGAPRTLDATTTGRIAGGFVFGGGGGGGGGCNNVLADSGGGGASGGVVLLAIRTLDNAGGVIEANGGAGAAATGTGDAGGGGGGGGGLVLVTYDTLTALGTLRALGGAGGAKTGAGVAGVAGSAGLVLSFSNTT